MLLQVQGVGLCHISACEVASLHGHAWKREVTVIMTRMMMMMMMMMMTIVNKGVYLIDSPGTSLKPHGTLPGLV